MERATSPGLPAHLAMAGSLHSSPDPLRQVQGGEDALWGRAPEDMGRCELMQAVLIEGVRGIFGCPQAVCTGGGQRAEARGAKGE